MTRSAHLDSETTNAVMKWAAQRRVPLTVSVNREGQWSNLRSEFIRYDAKQGLLQILYPIAGTDAVPPEISGEDELGLSFRRGHKKCIFVAQVVVRQRIETEDKTFVDALLMKIKGNLRELQRRAYQRITVPADQFVAVKLWEGGLPDTGDAAWPLCAGRLSNASVGGILVEINAGQNPRLSVGDTVGVELTPVQGKPPMLFEAQYRHCCLMGKERLGVGLQFIGLEHEIQGCTSITQLADFVRALQRSASGTDRV